ncbi:hypothetical protein H4R33_007224, partial [Dimargaris cristalligena]
ISTADLATEILDDDPVLLLWVQEATSSPRPACPAIRQVLDRYSKDVFAPLPKGLPPERSIDHKIDTGDATPIFRHPYRLTQDDLAEL